MRLIRSALLYTALAVTANALLPALALADRAALVALEALRGGTMKKLTFSEPKTVPEAVLLDEADGEHGLVEYQGKVVVLNFWATWCAPCLKEMPSLDALQAALGTEDFAVVPVAVGRNPVEAIDRFYDKAAIVNLPVLRDPKQAFSRAMGVLGLPLTVILNRQGQEVARLIGDAEWNGPEARAILAALIAE
jgi:thiol-disulfide isomerase/thioredoxin